jgi:hypothetical protein
MTAQYSNLLNFTEAVSRVLAKPYQDTKEGFYSERTHLSVIAIAISDLHVIYHQEDPEFLFAYDVDTLTNVSDGSMDYRVKEFRDRAQQTYDATPCSFYDEDYDFFSSVLQVLLTTSKESVRLSLVLKLHKHFSNFSAPLLEPQELGTMVAYLD